jgi:hypothetical protein
MNEVSLSWENSRIEETTGVCLQNMHPKPLAMKALRGTKNFGGLY